jgi:hypothetical protein
MAAIDHRLSDDNHNGALWADVLDRASLDSISIEVNNLRRRVRWSLPQ